MKGSNIFGFRAIQIVDSTSQAIVDPHIEAHWSNLSTAEESIIRINITSQGYENIR